MIEWMLILSGGVFRLVEVLKLGIIASLQSRLKFTDEIYGMLVVLVSLLLGIFAAGIGGANALALVPENSWTAQIPLWIGTLAAGLLIGLGTNVIHEFGEFFAMFKQRPTIQGTGTLLSSVEVTAESALVPIGRDEAEVIARNAANLAIVQFADANGIRIRTVGSEGADNWKPTTVTAQTVAEGSPRPPERIEG